MKLSEIEKKEFTDDEVDKIVYDGVLDDGLSSKYALVFGNSNLINQRVDAALMLYNSKRVQKLIFMGGIGGISNENKDTKSEALKMSELAIEKGVNPSDILIEDKSNNTFENVDNAFELIKDEISTLNNVIIVTSEFHIKRCYAIIKKKHPDINISMVPAKDGFSDKDNWFLSEMSWNSGRSLATYEAGLLVKYAKEEKIEDLDIKLDNYHK